MKSKKILLAILIVTLFLQAGCLYAVRYDGPYKGKVVDQETREPIEGAVVLGTWSVYHFGPGGGYSTFYDAKEAVTDKNGEFLIEGQGLRVLSSIRPMGFLIYKAGYSFYESHWDYVMKHQKDDDQIKWERELPVFSVKKLSELERRKYSLPLRPDDAITKMPFMTQELNKELKFKGLEPYLTVPGRVGGGE